MVKHKSRKYPTLKKQGCFLVLHGNPTVQFINATAYPQPKLDPSLFNPAHERLCDDTYLLRKETVQIALVIYGSDPL